MNFLIKPHVLSNGANLPVINSDEYDWGAIRHTVLHEGYEVIKYEYTPNSHSVTALTCSIKLRPG